MNGANRSTPGGPPARTVLGHQAAYAADPLGSLRGWTAAFGETVRLRFGAQQVLLLTSPGAVAEVLDRQADAFHKAPVVRRLAVPVIGHSLFTAEDEGWRRQRALIAPMMARTDEHLATIASAFRAMTGRWQSGEVIETTDE